MNKPKCKRCGTELVPKRKKLVCPECTRQNEIINELEENEDDN